VERGRDVRRDGGSGSAVRARDGGEGGFVIAWLVRKLFPLETASTSPVHADDQHEVEDEDDLDDDDMDVKRHRKVRQFQASKSAPRIWL
jgi:hypothetical protein